MKESHAAEEEAKKPTSKFQKLKHKVKEIREKRHLSKQTGVGGVENETEQPQHPIEPASTAEPGTETQP